MPGWEKLECKRRSLKRKETYNEFGRKIRFEPLESIPKVRKFDFSADDKERCRETLVWTEDILWSERTTAFIKLAKSKKFSEEQAFHILKYHNFEESLAECDLHIYKPLRGMYSSNERQTIKLIVNNICERIESGKNRDLNEILEEFPGHSIGELLDFHANNRLYIKKKTMKKKEKKSGVKKNTFSDFSRHVDYKKCGIILQKSSDEDTALSEVLSLDKGALDKFLQGRGEGCFDDISVDQVTECINQEDEPSLIEAEVSLRLETVLRSLDDLEVWMKGLKEQDSVLCHAWDNMDVSLLLLGLQKYGPDFDSLSSVIITKTAAMIESFYLTFRHRFGLDKILVEASS